MSEVLLEKRGANCFGFEAIDERTGRKRRDPAVVRAKGDLRLTAEELWFERHQPPVDIRIALQTVEWVKLSKTHNGKAFGFLPVLQVAFRTSTETQILGVCVGHERDALPWLERIDSLRTAHDSA